MNKHTRKNEKMSKCMNQKEYFVPLRFGSGEGKYIRIKASNKVEAQHRAAKKLPGQVVAQAMLEDEFTRKYIKLYNFTELILNGEKT